MGGLYPSGRVHGDLAIGKAGMRGLSRMGLLSFGFGYWIDHPVCGKKRRGRGGRVECWIYDRPRRPLR